MKDDKVQDTEQFRPSENHSHPTGEPKQLPILKESSTKRWIIAAAVVIIVIVIVAVAAWLWLSASPSKKADTVSQQAQDIKAYEKIIDTIALSERDTVIPIAVTSGIGGQTGAGAVVYDFAPYQVPDAPFRVVPKSGTGLAIAVVGADAEIRYTALAKHLKDNGLRLVSENTADVGGLRLQQDATLVAYTVYSSDKTVCSLARLAGKGSQDGQTLSIGCADVASYQEAAAAAKPFYVVYAKAKNLNEAKTTHVFGAPEVHDGAEGRKRAAVFQQDSADPKSVGTYLYYTTGSGAWNFLSATPKEGVLKCDAYNSPDLKAAFRGVACTSSTNTRETVG